MTVCNRSGIENATIGVCMHKSCSRPRKAKGYCGLHLERSNKNLDMDAPIGRWHYLDGSDKCTIVWCSNIRKSKRSICAQHAAIESVWGTSEPIVVCQCCDQEYLIKPAKKGRNRIRLCDECFQLNHFCPVGAVLCRHNMTRGSWLKMFLRQAGGCARCGRKDKQLQVDHDHLCCNTKNGRSCGKCIRGLLCGDCNWLVGKYETNQEATRRYLEMA